MKGDVVIVEEHHRRTAAKIVDRILEQVRQRERPTTIAVAGESGSGKSETGEALKEAFKARGVGAIVLGQDDYFRLPPKSNDARRRAGIDWVGPGEVRLDLLDAHLAAARSGSVQLRKPLVIYADDRIDEETVSLPGCQVLIAEGTYTSLLENVDIRVFITGNRLDTMAARRRRGREAPDPFIEDVLEIEHAIICEHEKQADVVITRDHDVVFREGRGSL